jgi:predicted RNA-binding Zn-ribbon protein involved in translation (DUF1610 family)
METCENCGRQIGKLETPRVHENHVLCAECWTRLAPQEAELVDDEPESPAGGAGVVRHCLGCGSVSPPVRKSKGSTIVFVLLLLIGVIPGLLYAILGGGHVYVCPDCGMKIGDAV